MQQRTVVVIEDEASIASAVAARLRSEGFAVQIAGDGPSGVALCREVRPDLVILDLMLPGLDGLTVCRAIRKDSPNQATPILMLTARREENDKVLGLDSGADDYLAKPFGVRELMARVRALLRRTASREPESAQASGPIVYRNIEVDPARRRVRVGTREVDLTSNEFQLLSVLLASPGIVFSREALLNRVWDNETFVTVRSVDTLIKRVRKKIETDPAEPDVILTVWGTGYKAADVS